MQCTQQHKPRHSSSLAVENNSTSNANNNSFINMSVTGLTRHAQGMRSAAAGGNVFLAEAQAAMATGDNTKVLL
jgi:hypothetical protein